MICAAQLKRRAFSKNYVTQMTWYLDSQDWKTIWFCLTSQPLCLFLNCSYTLGWESYAFG